MNPWRLRPAGQANPTGFLSGPPGVINTSDQTAPLDATLFTGSSSTQAQNAVDQSVATQQLQTGSGGGQGSWMLLAGLVVGGVVGFFIGRSA